MRAGIMAIALTPALQIASIVSSTFYSLWNLFAVRGEAVSLLQNCIAAALWANYRHLPCQHLSCSFAPTKPWFGL
jgi:hypothetical protein